jgi:integrase
MEQFITWYRSEPRLALNRTVVLRFRLYLESLGQAAGTITGRQLADRDQARLLLEKSDGESLRSTRDVAMIAALLGCGLRRSELASLRKEDVQLRQGHWAVLDLVGKGGHIRTVPMPLWGKGAVDKWMTAATVMEGRIFRAVSRHGTTWGKGISENLSGVWFGPVPEEWNLITLRLTIYGEPARSCVM